MSENETTTAEETAVTTLARFEVPSRLEKIEDPNDANHLTFVAEPFENGYGHTLGNSLRRVLLGSLEAPPLPPSASPVRSRNFPPCPVWWKM